MGVRYRYLLSLIVYLLVFNSISTVILHNEIVIETSSSSSSSPTDTSSQSSSSHTSNEAADIKKTGDDPDPGVEKLVEVPPAAADVVNDAQSQSQSNDPTPPNSPPYPSQTTTSESGTSGETVESSAQISPPTDQTNQTAEANSTTTNKSSQTEMVRAAAGVVVVNKAGGEEMQSFEEWKEMRLKSSASSSAQDKSTTSTSSSSTDPNSAGSAESATSGSGLPITSSSTQTASQSAHEDSPHQRRKNYASAECGAKIIASNPESNKPSNILSENKDDYMLNSCSNRVWFVVELCEPIRVIELELANFELFSNVPKQFRVYASERYVASSASSPNWPQKYLVGTFEAANVRTVQKFAIKDAIKETTPTTNTNQVDVNQSQQPNSSSPSSEQPNSNSNSHLLHNQNILMYAKYVRFEMLSHYGSEHYCPLSLVRIFGTSISDDEEAAAAAVSSSETDEVESRSIHVESSSTTQATTTTTKNKDEEKVNFLNLRLVKERVNLFAKSSQFLSNIIATFLAENFNLSKLFTVFSSNTDKNAANSASTTFSPPSTDSTSTTQQLDTSSSTKLTTLPPFDRRNQVLQIDLHKVLCFSSMRNTLDCCQCLPEDDEKSSTTATFMIRPYQTTTTTTTNNWMSKYCGYYFLMITSAQAQLNTSLLFKFLNNIKYSNGEAPLQLHPSNFTRFSLNNVNYYILNEWLDNQTAAHFYFKKSPSSETNPTPQNEEHSTLNLNMFASSLDGRNITSPPIIEPNEVNETNENSNSTIEVKPTPSIVDETPSLESTPQQQQQQQSQEEPVVDVNEGSKNVETSTSSPPPPPPPENQDTTSTSTSTSTNNNNAQIPTVVTPVIIGNGKDAVLMRLSNRVKILELNMTLSSQYLEKLSQHYKKQMDEMQRAFNVTTSALLETIRIADERDLKQNERIVTIERRVEKMQNSMEALENLLNDLKFQTDILIWTIIVILNIIILIEVVRWLRNAFSSSSPSPSSKPNKTLNRTISSQQSSARIHLSASEIEALIEERVRRATESLREELIEQQRQKQFTTTTTMTEPPSTPQRVETLTPTTTTSLENAMAQPQAAAAAAAVVSSTLATVVAIAAAATAQCSTLGAQHHGEEKS